MFSISLEVKNVPEPIKYLTLREAGDNPGFYRCSGRSQLYFINDSCEVFLLLNGNLYISDMNPPEMKYKQQFFKATEKIVFKMEN